MLGDRAAHREQARIALAMLAVTALYEAASAYVLGPDFALNWYEVIGTWSGLTCVWLSRTRNILCWPWGIVSAAALGAFFAQIGLPGQQWLNWGYFLVIQLWAWPNWVFGGAGRTELPVSRLSFLGRAAVLLSVAAGTVAVYVTIGLIAPGSLYPIVDALVVASSVVAQFLLGRKIVESWVLWLGPVNAASIFLFAAAGAYTVMALYVAFFIHALVALRSWNTVFRSGARIGAPITI
ncbi:MAG: hypothetical protein A2408_00245 [Candidatus Yonathbacteria bacterium RIFOXYC1_FULL_52_10]|uniref:Nicotinamide mononucleotide transporter PnuC n=1 Tax=Candidatus Yonathbacteria bacterium RIFOXYD1_FULL_52_36 TaxID=1802730 RepID=A0A1G2SP60_9BACT|nr:MAG: hypothetical protein A2408_00245 [Candidatus Yonathbacteria bacterium RIFOXYC1_FULL_52_10]OHA86171.1 MAG: hypothetical protein A2591_01330 [Candidatus Yonathbacteria bacterium RIFOXYD1_FULL_52_36]